MVILQITLSIFLTDYLLVRTWCPQVKGKERHSYAQCAKSNVNPN